MIRHRHTATLLLALAVVLPAVADEPRRAALDLDPATGRDATRSKIDRLLGVAFDPEHADLAAMLDTGYGAWAPLPPAQLLPCEAGAMTAAELHAVLDEAEGLLEQLEYGDAGARLSRAERALCACSDPFVAADAVRIAFLQGITDHYSGDPDSARRSFQRAAERDPGLTWDPDYPPEARAAFNEGLAGARGAPRAALTAVEGLPRILVDGQLVGPAPVELFGERHVLQVVGDDGGLHGAWLHTGGADAVHLIDANALRAGLREARPGAYPLLGALAAHAGYDELAVVSPGERDTLMHYRADAGTWLEVRSGTSDAHRPARRHEAAGLAALGAGAAMVIAGAAVMDHHASAASELEPTMLDSAGMYDLLLPDFEKHRRGTDAGTAIAVAGGVVVATGLVLLARGGALRRGEGPQLGVAASPGVAWITVQGRF
jgi:hypothetical protein